MTKKALGSLRIAGQHGEIGNGHRDEILPNGVQWSQSLAFECFQAEFQNFAITLVAAFLLAIVTANGHQTVPSENGTLVVVVLVIGREIADELKGNNRISVESRHLGDGGSHTMVHVSVFGSYRSMELHQSAIAN